MPQIKRNILERLIFWSRRWNAPTVFTDILQNTMMMHNLYFGKRKYFFLIDKSVAYRLIIFLFFCSSLSSAVKYTLQVDFRVTHSSITTEYRPFFLSMDGVFLRKMCCCVRHLPTERPTNGCFFVFLRAYGWTPALASLSSITACLWQYTVMTLLFICFEWLYRHI